MEIWLYACDETSGTLRLIDVLDAQGSGTWSSAFSGDGRLTWTFPAAHPGDCPVRPGMFLWPGGSASSEAPETSELYLVERTAWRGADSLAVSARSAVSLLARRVLPDAADWDGLPGAVARAMADTALTPAARAFPFLVNNIDPALGASPVAYAPQPGTLLDALRGVLSLGGLGLRMAFDPSAGTLSLEAAAPPAACVPLTADDTYFSAWTWTRSERGWANDAYILCGTATPKQETWLTADAPTGYNRAETLLRFGQGAGDTLTGAPLAAAMRAYGRSVLARRAKTARFEGAFLPGVTPSAAGLALGAPVTLTLPDGETAQGRVDAVWRSSEGFHGVEVSVETP